MIQKFSFDFKDRYFDFDGVSFAFRISTLENVYGPDPDQTNQVKVPGFAHVDTAAGGTASLIPTEITPRSRRWAVYQEYSGHWVLNLSEDAAYTRRSGRMKGTAWALVRNSDPKTMRDRWYSMLERDSDLRDGARISADFDLRSGPWTDRVVA